GIDKNLGGLLLAIITMISVILGMNKVIDILGSIGPIIALVAIAVSLKTININYENLYNIDYIVNNLEMTKAIDSWPIAAFVYSGL
ncbi:hypothetical protein, partial [Faecalibacillus intestinalis]|uniref:hypothetical protein n=1 Tax=Faecalibacillus intestinalis TaxID=1982626 RepID=UPI001EE0DBA0